MQLNAVVVRRFATAREEAAAADRALRDGHPPGLLHGLPITIKDAIDLAGLPTSCGADPPVAPQSTIDALAVARLRAAGAVVLGKTNLPLYASDFQTTNEPFGTTANPWALDRTPGGSSGGGAAAIAAGFSAAELGSDLAGSLRLPAHFCGVCALKPTHGLVPLQGARFGPGALTRDRELAVLGPMSRDVSGLARLFEVLAGPGPVEARGWSLKLPDAMPCPGSRPVALWLDDPFCPPDPAVREGLASLADRLAAAGLRLAGAGPAGFDAQAFFELHCRLMYGELCGELPDDVFAWQQRRASQRKHPVADRLARGLTQSHRDWLAARERQATWRLRFEAFFSEWRLLLCPVAPTVAPPHDSTRLELREQPLGGQPAPVLQHMSWLLPASTLGLPAAVVPAGLDPDGLPYGLQVIGPRFADRDVLAMAAWIEQVRGPMPEPIWSDAGYRSHARPDHAA